ncbi:uncharacterized protein [Rutidosis leptorrhynchoides]|uniref:uncharacterized protein n=1 Tax=Rutidosis leptorrhynchoides TaxID=125765 RepID=UPI003A9A34C3
MAGKRLAGRLTSHLKGPFDQSSRLPCPLPWACGRLFAILAGHLAGRIILGHKISCNAIEVHKGKIEVIKDLPKPNNVKAIRSFLGHAGFYKRFIKDFSKIARPMTKLLEKEQRFVFHDDCKKSFAFLKARLIQAPILVSSNWDEPFELMCDASDYALGAVLGQRINNHFHPIYYASKTLTGAQINLHNHRKEIFVFDIEIRDEKGAENLAANHLSRLKNPNLEKLDNSVVKDTFLDESLMRIDHDPEVPYFAYIDNYLASGVLQKRESVREIWVNTPVLNSIPPSNDWSSGEHEPTTFKTPIGTTPFRLVYRKACHLPMEVEHGAYWALKQVNLDLDQVGEKRTMQLNVLDELMLVAYEKSLTYKEKTKKWHDARLKGVKDFHPN